MPTLASKLVRYPARTSLLWYAGILLLGTMILRLPACSGNPSSPITWLDALFTATSALCVTGLSVRSTPNDFSFLGQVVILSLIQIGGLGIMTITTFILAQLGGRAGLRQQAIISETLGASSSANLKLIIVRVFLLTIGIELLGALVMLPRFAAEYPLGKALWHSLFHSISAFCNAGFALYDDSVVRYSGDWLVNLTLMALIIAGGIGFPVLTDLARWLRNHRTQTILDLKLHTKLTVIGSFLLVFGGAFVLGGLEADGVLVDKSWSQRMLIPIFQSVSCRTAGYNSVDIAELSSASLFFMIVLMVIGAGACSTGGGMKVATVGMLLLHAVSRLQGRKQVEIFRRTIPESSIDRAMAAVMLFLTVAAIALTLLLMIEQGDERFKDNGSSFLAAAFEVASALGTVGLTTGLTTQLSAAGKLIIIALMFLGRLGPITVFAALTIERRPRAVQYSVEEPLVG